MEPGHREINDTHVPTGHGDEVELEFLRPHLTAPHFPTAQVAGYALSLALTFVSFGLVWYRLMPISTLVTVVLILAFIQAGIQLGVFMHLREGRGTTWHLPVLGLGLFVALGIVGFSIWIMLFKSGVS